MRDMLGNTARLSIAMKQTILGNTYDPVAVDLRRAMQVITIHTWPAIEPATEPAQDARSRVMLGMKGEG